MFWYMWAAGSSGHFYAFAMLPAIDDTRKLFEASQLDEHNPCEILLL